ncbi:hypothetical protein STEG23_016785 [Scotinomys teguina]
MTVTPLGRDQDCSLKIRESNVPAPWFLDPGGWSKTAVVRLFFIFPGICTLSLASVPQIKPPFYYKELPLIISRYRYHVSLDDKELVEDWQDAHCNNVSSKLASETLQLRNHRKIFNPIGTSLGGNSNNISGCITFVP